MTAKINLTNEQIDRIKVIADAYRDPKNEALFALSHELSSVGYRLKLSVEAFDTATQMICEKVFDLTDYDSF